MVYNKKRGKKGISPLIATVLLIGFTVALAVTVGTFLLNKAQESSEDVIEFVEGTGACNKITVSVESVVPNYISRQVQYTVVNRGAFGIDALFVRFFYDNDQFGSNEDKFDERLFPEKSDEGRVVDMKPDDSQGQINKIEFIPIRDGKGCSDKKASFVFDGTGFIPGLVGPGGVTSGPTGGDTPSPIGGDSFSTS